MRQALIDLAILTALLIVAAPALPFFVDADSFRPRIESELRQTLARPVQISRLKVSLLAGGVTAQNITVADDPAFSSKPFLRASSIDIGVDMRALIFSRTLNVRSITLLEPQV